MCQMRCQITATVPHQLYPVEKLTRNRAEGDLGPESDRCVECDTCATVIDLPAVMTLVSTLIVVALVILVTVAAHDPYQAPRILLALWGLLVLLSLTSILS